MTRREMLATTISISPADIARGVPGDAQHCSVARATARRFRGYKVMVVAGSAFLRKMRLGSKWVQFALPHSASRVVELLDSLRRREIRPLLFHLLPR